MGVLEPQGGLAEHLASGSYTQWSDGLQVRLHDQTLQVDAVHVFHCQEINAVGLAGVVSANDVRMLQGADRLHLPLEPGYGLRLVEIAFGEYLQGHDLVQMDLPRFVHDAHAAAAKFFLDFVVAQPAALHHAVENGPYPIAQLGEPRAVLFQSQEVPLRLPQLQFRFQQLAYQPFSLRRLYARGETFNLRMARRPLLPPGLLELVTEPIDLAGNGHLRLGLRWFFRPAHDRVSFSRDHFSRMRSNFRSTLRRTQRTNIEPLERADTRNRNPP